jgi:translation initiation factor 3 subunit B
VVRVDRAKTKKSTATSLEIFRMREKDVPVDVMELPLTEEMDNLFWEPHGHKFALLATSPQRTLVNFYQVETAASASQVAVKLLKSVEGKGVNTVSWSPKGRFCVLAGVRGLSGDLQFWDAEDLVMMGSGEHYMCTDIDWDPTGRYVVTSVSYWRIQNDTGFVMWTFAGQELTKQNMTQFKQFIWRPRPPTLLTKAHEKKIKKNLKDYSKEFEDEDALETNKASAEVVGRRRAQWNEYKTYITKCKASYEEDRATRVKIYGFDPDVKELIETETVVEDVYDEEIIVLE